MTVMRKLSTAVFIGVAITSVIAGFSQSAKAASLSYKFERFVPGGSAVGTITTEGTLGNIIIGEAGINLNSFFTDWDIIITTPENSFRLTPANSDWLARGIINATPSELTLNLALTRPDEPGDDSVFQLQGGSVPPNQGYSTAAVYSWQLSPKNSPLFPLVTTEQLRVFNSNFYNPNPPISYTLSLVPTVKSVPEPASVIGLLALGILGAAFLPKSKQKSASSVAPIN